MRACAKGRALSIVPNVAFFQSPAGGLEPRLSLDCPGAEGIRPQAGLKLESASRDQLITIGVALDNVVALASLDQQEHYLVLCGQHLR